MKRIASLVFVVLTCGMGLRAFAAGDKARYDIPAVTVHAGGTIAADEVWRAAAGPYQLTDNLIIPAGRTLTMEPGVVVYLAPGINITVADGGRILAEGTETRGIRFAGVPGSGQSWGGITIDGSPGSPETRMAYVSFADNGKTCIDVSGGTLSLDHAAFATTTHQYLSLDDSSFLISHCHFPTATKALELIHGTGGIKAGGRGIVRHSFFGSTSGYNDVMDFTGGNRELNQPIIQYYNNVFIGSGDDILDLDGTDAWIEGNIFLHTHRNGSPDTSAPVSGGSDGGHTSEITILGNLMFDCDNAAMAKEGNFFTLINNTIVRVTQEGGQDSASGVVCVRDTIPSLTTYGRGFYLEGNIIVDAEQLVRNYDATQTSVILDDNILPMSWTGPGSGNLVADPMLTYIPQVSETQFTSWEQAQVMREWFSLRPGSPARGAGPNGADRGGAVPLGASVSGEPYVTARTGVSLLVGVDVTGHGIPTAGFPRGSGFTYYRWRLDSGSWSEEMPIGSPLEIEGLAQGPHRVEVVGRNDAGCDQNDPELGVDARVTVSRTWTVDASYQQLVINEVLAANTSAVEHEGTFPGMVELYYDGVGPCDLSGMGLQGGKTDSARYGFPVGSTIAPGQYLVLYADAGVATSGTHLGFALDPNGDGLVLYDRSGGIVDSIDFGRQLADYSIGRVGQEGAWRLTNPSLGSRNVAHPTGDRARIKINEWLVEGQVLSAGPFIELYNPNADPVDMEGMHVTSDPAPQTAESVIGPLSFIAGHGYVVIPDDGLGDSAPVPLPVSLAGGTIRLIDGQAVEIDRIPYGPQTADVSEGRTPDGMSRFDFFVEPTPGAANPGGPDVVVTIREVVPEAADKRVLVPTGAISDDWRGGGEFDDAGWILCSGSPGGVGYEGSSGYESVITLDLETQMYGTGKNNTCYIRVPFTLDAKTLADVNAVTLKVKYDDGFVAYLNGVEVARRNFTGTPAWNSRANGAGESDVTDFDESIDISQFIAELKPGPNILAIQGMNSGSTSSDFLISVAMDIAERR